MNFEALGDLYNSANELLHSSIIKSADFVHKDQEKWVYEVISEASLKMLDLCGISKDVLLLVKQHIQDLHFMLRRSIKMGHEKIAAFKRYRNKLKKVVLKSLNALKRMKIISIYISGDSIMGHKFFVILDGLRDVREKNISVLGSVLSLFDEPWLERERLDNKSFVSKFIGPRGPKVNDIRNGMVGQSANKRLERVEIAIEDLEVQLECNFRRLLENRVSLLNLLTN